MLISALVFDKRIVLRLIANQSRSRGHEELWDRQASAAPRDDPEKWEKVRTAALHVLFVRISYTTFSGRNLLPAARDTQHLPRRRHELPASEALMERTYEYESYRLERQLIFDAVSSTNEYWTVRFRRAHVHRSLAGNFALEVDEYAGDNED